MSGRFPALGSDPAPGDPEAVRRCCREHRRAAAELDALAAEVARAAADASSWRGAAATAFTAAVAPVDGRLRVAAQALAATAVRLAGWAHELEELQAQARVLERAAQDALDRRGAAHARAPGGSHVVDTLDAEHDLHRALSRADDLATTWRVAGRRAAAGVAAATDAAPPLPAGVGAWVWEHRVAISAVSDASAVLSLPVVAVPGVGPPASAVLGAVALAGHTALAVSADGAGSDVLLGASVLGLGAGSVAVRQIGATPGGEVAVRLAASTLHRGGLLVSAIGSALTVQKRVLGSDPAPVAPGSTGATHRLLVAPVLETPSRRRR